MQVVGSSFCWYCCKSKDFVGLGEQELLLLEQSKACGRP